MNLLVEESEPLQKDEWFYRFVFRHNLKNTPKLRASLKPKPKDVDGISIFRKVCLGGPEDCLLVVAEDKRDDHGVVQIPYSLIIELGLSVVSKPIPSVPGHCVIPELNHGADWESDWLTDSTRKIAEKAISNVVHRPQDRD